MALKCFCQQGESVLCYTFMLTWIISLIADLGRADLGRVF